MTDQTAAIEVWARVLCAADAHVHGYPTWQQLPTTPGPSGRSQDDYRKVAAWLLPRMTVADPAEQAPATDQTAEVARLHDELLASKAEIAKLRALLGKENQRANDAITREETTEQAAEEAQQEARRLGLMVDEYGAGASALTDKLRRARERHRETCILARGEVKPTAFRCGLCEVLDAPAAPLRRLADEAQQPSADPSWPRRAWDLGLLHKGGDPHHCPACVAQPEPPKDFICPGAEANAEVLANPQPAVEAQQPTQRNIQCPDAFWRPRPHAPHNWQQGPDTEPVHCRGVAEAQQPKEAGERVVAYRSALPGAMSIYCTRHTDELGDGVLPLTSDDLPNGGLCAGCGADVLIEQQPKEA